MARSHLKRHLKEQSLRNSILAIGGMIVVIVLVIMFGMDFLIKFSLLVRHSSGSTTASTKDDLAYIEPPIINPLSDATKSATITVDGDAGDKQTVKLYINDKLVDQTDVDKNKQFSFSNVSLDKGNNTIKVKAVTPDGKESDYSPVTQITYIDKPPSLDINSPHDGDTVSKDNPLSITGKTDPNVKVTVNDFWAIVQDDGNFSYRYTVHDGDNDIKVVATDDAGNQTTKEFHVKTN